MNPRDRKLRTARRLGAGIVATGVVGSLGVAGLVGLSSLQNGSTSAATTTNPSTTNPSTTNPSTTNPSTTNPSTSSQQSTVRQQAPTRGDDGGSEEGDDGFSFPTTGSQTQSQLQPPTLQPGSGAPHASTSGS